MKVRSVKITLETEEDNYSAIWITWRELSALVGGLNIVHDLMRVDQFVGVGDHDIVNALNTHLHDFSDANTPDGVKTLLTRLYCFVKDRGIIG